MKCISYVVPVYNEQAGLKVFYDSLLSVIAPLSLEYELIFVDDGSRDQSANIIDGFADINNKVKPVFLARNFGKEIATTAGINSAKGDAVMILDADGQHPVELIPLFIEKWQAGSDVVVGVRTSNKKEGIVKRWGSHLFYFVVQRLGAKDIIPGSTDFRIIDRRVVNAFNRLTEHNRVTRALIDWLGFEREIIKFSAKAREHGEASYSLKKLTSLAFNGFVSLSFTPLFMAGYLGASIMLLSILGVLFIIIEKYLLNDFLSLNITGTALLAVMILFLVGLILACQGLLSIYIARIYTETQNRPLYITKD